MSKTVLGTFPRRLDAETCIRDLQDLGFNPKDISIVMKDQTEARNVASRTGSQAAGHAISGATAGGVIGAIAGLLVGIGAIALPGIGALLIGGPIAAVLGLTGAAATTASGAVTGVLAGGLIGALAGLGIPEKDARVYEDRIRQGGVLIAVPTGDRAELDVRQVLEDHNAEQIKVIDTTAEDRISTPLQRVKDYEREQDRPAAYYSDVGRRRRITSEDDGDWFDD